MAEKSVAESAKSFAYRQVISYLDGDPDTNIPKLLDWADKLDKGGHFLSQRTTIRNVISTPTTTGTA